MMRIAKACVFAGATAAVVVGGTLVSYASWIATGPAATATVKAGAMPSGVTPGSAKTADGNARVTWTAQTLSGVAMTAYVVTAHDTDQTPLPAITRTVTASGSGDESAVFTAAELAGGKWKWAITPKLRSWTGTEGPLSNPKLVYPGGPATALASAVTAGTAKEVAQVAAPVRATPTPASTAEAPTREPAVDPAPTVTEKAKTESPVVDPSPSESAGPAPTASASELNRRPRTD